MPRSSPLRRGRLQTLAVRLRQEGSTVVITERTLVETPAPPLPAEERSLQRVVRLAARILCAFGNHRV